MTRRHAFIHRNALSGLALFAALGCFQVAQAQATITRAPIMTGWDILRSSNSTATVLIPSTTSPSAYVPAPGGNVLTPAPSGGGLVLSGKAPVPVAGAPGKVIDVVAKAPVARAGLARGAARFLVGPGGAIAIAAAPYLWDWFKGQGVGINTGPDFLERPFTLRTDEMVCPAKTPEDYNQPPTPAAWISKQKTSTTCEWGWLYPNGYYSGVSPILQSVKIEGQPRPASADEVASHVEQPSAPPLTVPVVESAIKTGVDPFGGTDPIPQVSGPASIPGQKSTTTEQIRVKPGTTTPAQPGEASEPATRTTTTTTTTNFNYNDNKVTNNVTNQTTTTITNNITNQTTTEGDKITETVDEDDQTKPEEEKPDLCEKYPDILACSKPELDTPDDEIPRTEKQLTFEVEDTFGGGSCPADVYGTVHGQSLKMYDWGQTCNVVTTYLRPLILLLGAMGALFILIPGRDA